MATYAIITDTGEYRGYWRGVHIVKVGPCPLCGYRLRVEIAPGDDTDVVCLECGGIAGRVLWGVRVTTTGIVPRPPRAQ